MKYFQMKILLVVCLAFAKAELIQAQQEFKGVATYMSKMTFEKPSEEQEKKNKARNSNMSAETRKMIDDALAKAGEETFTLHFTKDESIYEKVKELEKPTAGGMKITMSFTGGGSTYGTTYKDLNKKIYLREDEIQGKEFLIQDELESYDWKITGETKMIGQYQAIKATHTIPAQIKEQKEGEKVNMLDLVEDKDDVITAWFTPQIPISNGPGAFQGLPGLILELNSGNTTLLCSKIEMNPKKFELRKPKDGKKINQEKFDKLQEKKMKEAMERFKRRSGKDGVIIETRTIGG
ncbi:MAG: GLPGLI family protein [Nonlabens sp.]